MPTGYVKKLAKKHGVSSATAEKHWDAAKSVAKKEGHGEDYGYVTSIFKNMMHENVRIPSLKDLTNGMTFKYFLIAEQDADTVDSERSPAYQHLTKFAQFNELPFKARRQLEKEATEVVNGYEELSQEEKDSVDGYLHDLVIDKMQSVVGQGSMIGDWKGEEDYQKRQQFQSDLDAALDAEDGAPKSEVPSDVAPSPVAKPKRFSAGPRHIAAMRQQNIPVDRAAEAPADSNEIGGSVKSYYKPWSALSDEQRAGRAKLAKKHGTMYRVKNSGWFRVLPPEKQAGVLAALKQGADVATAKASVA